MKDKQVRGPRLLIVDDDDAFRSLVKIALSDEGFDVDEASNGEQGIAAAREKGYDLILLDIKMPDLDGLQVLKVIRQDAPSADVMMITGYHDVPLVVESMRLGAREYLTKPISSGDLIQRIRSSLRAHTAESRLKELQADFTSRLLYEIRNPLSTVRSAVSFLLKGMAGPLTEQQHEILNHIDSTGNKTFALVNDMIDLTKFELGRVYLEKKPTNLDVFIPAVCNRLEHQLQAKSLTLNVRIDSNIPTMELDAEKIEQVIYNLLDNAIKYSNEGASITVEATTIQSESDGTGPGYAKIAVIDTGAGILKEELPFVFDKYKEFLTGKISAKKTTGIGLAICRSIVEAHRGTMIVQSELGKGSTFKVLLPVVPV